MNKEDAMFDLEAQIGSWRNCLKARGHLLDADISELENHLREETEDLARSGLTLDEAFLISVKRLGNVDSISQEYSKINTEQLWKQLLLDPVDPQTKFKTRRDIWLIVVLALLAGTLAKLPELFGIRLYSPIYQLFYFKNLSFFVLPLIAGYFLIKRNPGWKMTIGVMAVFVISALLINFYPSFAPKNTEFLTGVHLPIFLWLVTGMAYAGTEWGSTLRRMDFIRFTGETFIYTVLIGCGVMVLAVFTQMIFNAIRVDLTYFIRDYLLVYGGCATPIITIYLVEAKQSIVENFAPILAKIFSPLFMVTMVAFLAVMLVSGRSPFTDRNFLIGFDIMLALVLGLVLYVISARNIHEKPGSFDYLNFALIITALIIDSIALSAILLRLSSFGISPNKLAALGENLALLVNLAGLAWFYGCYFLKKKDFAALEKWQTGYLSVYLVWGAAVAFLFPVCFGFH